LVNTALRGFLRGFLGGFLRGLPEKAS